MDKIIRPFLTYTASWTVSSPDLTPEQALSTWLLSDAWTPNPQQTTGRKNKQNSTAHHHIVDTTQQRLNEFSLLRK